MYQCNSCLRCLATLPNFPNQPNNRISKTIQDFQLKMMSTFKMNFQFTSNFCQKLPLSSQWNVFILLLTALNLSVYALQITTKTYWKRQNFPVHFLGGCFKFKVNVIHLNSIHFFNSLDMSIVLGCWRALKSMLFILIQFDNWVSGKRTFWF